jgi:hypothetical protein
MARTSSRRSYAQAVAGISVQNSFSALREQSDDVQSNSVMDLESRKDSPAGARLVMVVELDLKNALDLRHKKSRLLISLDRR